MKNCKLELIFNNDDDDKVEDADFTYWYEPDEFTIKKLENAFNTFKAALFKAGVKMGEQRRIFKSPARRPDIFKNPR